MATFAALDVTLGVLLIGPVIILAISSFSIYRMARADRIDA